MVALTIELLERAEFHNQVKYIIENGDSSSLTATQIRSTLESHFDLEKDALKGKPYKKVINALIDKIYGEMQKVQKKPPQEHTPEATDSSREASPTTKSFSQKRKAPSPEKETEEIAAKKPKVETDNKEEEETKPKKTSRAKKQSPKIISDGEEEEDDEDEMEKDEETKDFSNEQEDEDESNSFTPPPAKKKATSKSTKSNTAPTKDDESVKRLKQFINKCGVRKVWAKELAECRSTTAEIRKLKSILEELGVHGRPTLEKCEAVKKERELKAELDSLDTNLIINETGRRTRSRNNGSSRPTYAVDSSSSSEEEEDDDNEDSADESNEDEDKPMVFDNDVKGQIEREDEESSGDEFKSDESDDYDA
ncbi:hypothetical protein BD408DRAFT_434497 [Parasitella parasitica]|nr:hypothetical protein BD408DRAFT_434497 [Parasitella parasitica]